MGIIKKLDIVINKDRKYSELIQNQLLIEASPEMLEALIEFASWYKEPWKYNARPAYKFGETFIELIEKATGKTWAEIKGLL